MMRDSVLDLDVALRLRDQPSLRSVGGGLHPRRSVDGWADVVCRFNSDSNMLLATAASRCLRLHLDSLGLRYELDPPRSRTNVVELVERGDIRQSMFAFRDTEDEWTLSDQNYPVGRQKSSRVRQPVLVGDTWKRY
jgi:hypothetical protein